MALPEPDVTVIIPVYNTVPYLEQTLTSLLDQTLPHERFEVIAVDDGSTDGSGELLDSYAAAHPDVIRVVHQANSGGPATPCNVGLSLAEGRYVYFLGSDDRLGPEALARMVEAADRWGSDVLAARVVGVGRTWSQKIFAESAESIPFPSRLLAGALSNTKLFRRSLLVEHGIRYPLDLRVGSDQPFTVDAMLAASKISVLSDYDYYLANRRADGSNLTFSTGWQTRLDCLSRVMAHIALRIPAGPERDVVLHRHFDGEIGTLLRETWPELEAAERAELHSRVRNLCEDLLSDGIRAVLAPLTRARFALLCEGRTADVDRLAGLENAHVPVRRDDAGLYLGIDWLVDEFGTDLVRIPEEHLRRVVGGSLGPTRATLVDDELRLEADWSFPADLAVAARLVLTDAVDGIAPGSSRRTLPVKGVDRRRQWPVELVPRGGEVMVRAIVPLAELPPNTWKTKAVRWQFDIGGLTYSVTATSQQTIDLGLIGERDLVWRPDLNGRAVLCPERHVAEPVPERPRSRFGGLLDRLRPART